jgi:hypothetical protein
MANDFLMEIWRSGQISLQQMLECGSFPFADELMQSVQIQQEQLAKGQQPDSLSPELMAQIQNGVNPEAMKLAKQWAA